MQHGIDQCSFAMVNVSNNGNVSEVGHLFVSKILKKDERKISYEARYVSEKFEAAKYESKTNCQLLKPVRMLEKTA
jgi:hypothetical protein